MATALQMDLLLELEKEYGSISCVPEREPRLQELRKSANRKTRTKQVVLEPIVKHVAQEVIPDTPYNTHPICIGDSSKWDKTISKASYNRWSLNRLYFEINGTNCTQLVTYNSIIKRSKGLGFKLMQEPFKVNRHLEKEVMDYLKEQLVKYDRGSLDILAYDCNMHFLRRRGYVRVTPKIIAVRKQTTLSSARYSEVDALLN